MAISRQKQPPVLAKAGDEMEDVEQENLFGRRCLRCVFWKPVDGSVEWGHCNNLLNKVRPVADDDSVLFPADFGCRFFENAVAEYQNYWRMVLDATVEYLGERLAQGYPGDKVVSAALHVANTSLRLRFRQMYGVTMRTWHREKRMVEARKLLEEGFQVGEVCQKMGAENHGNFSASFKKVVGVTMVSLQVTQWYNSGQGDGTLTPGADVSL